MSDLVFWTASQIAKAIRERQVSAQDVLEAHLQQIKTHNPKVNAIVTLDEEHARQQARAADKAITKGEIWGALHGVPITAKDCYETVGLRSTCGYKKFFDYIPTQDATIIARMKASGAILLGKTNMAILASDMQALSDFGRTNNPWDLSCTAGGSSGGSAAAVAAGFVPMDVCTGLGGSARIPAHFCGVFGIKPTENRVSMAGAWPAPLEGDTGLQYLYAPGVMTRAVEDLKLWLSIVEGEDERWIYAAPAPPQAADSRPLNTYRIAWTDDFGEISASQETRNVLTKVTQILIEQGCQLEKASPSNFDYTSAWETYGELIGAWLASRPIPVQPILKDNLRKIIAGGSVIKGALRGSRLTLKQYSTALARRSRLMQQMDRFLAQWDAWICPVVPFPAFKHQTPGKPIHIEGQQVPYVLGGVAYTSIFTLTGHPVVVLPIGQTQNGLPIGIHLVGKRWKDYQLLDLTEKIVAVTGTVSHPPGY
ncbi:amidase [Pseudanabaena sp. FACHB-2040]|uniref:amidase n=1 Tax=Pseudanabaena sp. FACHB-2040 TaxID=2692859 RepID=UPI0016893571|nr:amidase [Pseudanabaena sp. FACHB-2040]MBD2259709.1 amidase [Pseudanabaena sp. FACHB-2040]